MFKVGHFLSFSKTICCWLKLWNLSAELVRNLNIPTKRGKWHHLSSAGYILIWNKSNLFSGVFKTLPSQKQKPESHAAIQKLQSYRMVYERKAIKHFVSLQFRAKTGKKKMQQGTEYLWVSKEQECALATEQCMLIEQHSGASNGTR